MTVNISSELKRFAGRKTLRELLRTAIALGDNSPVETSGLRDVLHNAGIPKSVLSNISSTLSKSKEFLKLPAGWELHPEEFQLELEELGLGSASSELGRDLAARPVVFFGHGRSAVWRGLKDYVVDKLGCEYEEYNRSSTVGQSRQTRLIEMLRRANFAVLVLTAEDQTKDGNLRARENVVHEVGLFQGKLGFARAIVALQKGCEEFSNIAGLDQVRFENDPMEKAHEIRDALVREGLIRA